MYFLCPKLNISFILSVDILLVKFDHLKQMYVQISHHKLIKVAKILVKFLNTTHLLKIKNNVISDKKPAKFTSLVINAEKATERWISSRRQGRAGGADLYTPITLKSIDIMLKRQCLMKYD